MKHVGAIAGRELRSFFTSSVAYVVLALWALLAATFFLASVIAFDSEVSRLQQFGAVEQLELLNLNDHLIGSFLFSMWFLSIFAFPAITMGLFAAERANGTEELLLTSPLTIWEIVLGKFVAGGTFAAVMTAVAAFFPGMLFAYGDPEVGKTLAGVLALFLVSLTYVAIGGFASSLTRNQLVAFLVTLGLLFLVGLMIPQLVVFGLASDALSGQSALVEVMRWIGTGDHFERMLTGLVESRDLVYFGVVIAGFLLLTKTAVESVRWR
ncbi:MAG: ABC transporter permease [Myxococcota bacterium]|nr:ABC transporter permease [Myxococcota bacterium]